MAVRPECQHYVMKSVRSGDRVEQCRLGANTTLPFACPDGCVFLEMRSTSPAGWHVASNARPDDRRGGPGQKPGR